MFPNLIFLCGCKNVILTKKNLKKLMLVVKFDDSPSSKKKKFLNT